VAPVHGARRSIPCVSPNTGRAIGDDSRSGDESRDGLGLSRVPHCPRLGTRRRASAAGPGRVGGRAGGRPADVPTVREGPDLGPIFDDTHPGRAVLFRCSARLNHRLRGSPGAQTSRGRATAARSGCYANSFSGLGRGVRREATERNFSLLHHGRAPRLGGDDHPAGTVAERPPHRYSALTLRIRAIICLHYLKMPFGSRGQSAVFGGCAARIPLSRTRKP
jgi:hypothetical protein